KGTQSQTRRARGCGQSGSTRRPSSVYRLSTSIRRQRRRAHAEVGGICNSIRETASLWRFLETSFTAAPVRSLAVFKVKRCTNLTAATSGLSRTDDLSIGRPTARAWVHRSPAQLILAQPQRTLRRQQSGETNLTSRTEPAATRRRRIATARP